MAEDNITPAVNLQQQEMPNEMSAAEFQSRLYAWFEDRGLLSELRAHLRRQMIGVLKDTAIGRTVTGQQKQLSPKLQALNLLIAEFLLQQEYHYSLSVFSTEVPLISVLPEFPGLMMNHSTNKSDDGKKWQFSEKDMWDILETLGVQSDTDEGKHIFNTYYNCINKEPLLTCVVRMFHTIKSKSRTNIVNEEKEVEHEKLVQGSSAPENNKCVTWLKNINEILSSNNVNAQNSEEIVNILKGIIEVEKKRLKDEAREEFLKLQITLQLQVARKEEEQRKKFAKIQQSLDIEKGRLESENHNGQIKINEFEHRVQRHQEVLRDRYQVLHVRERDVHEREQQLRQRGERLDAQQQRLETGYENLYREQRTVSDLQEKLQRELKEKQKAAKSDANFLRDLQEECQNMRNQITNTQEAVLNATGKSIGETAEQPISDDLDIQDAEQALVKGLIRQLQIENSGLRTLNSEQQFRIDELSQRAVLLMHDLENSQAAVAAASRPRSGILSAPPLAAPAARPPSRFVISSNSGAGEEGDRPTLATSPAEFRQYPNLRDARRRVPPRRLTVHSSSSSEDHSPTTDILQEARERLRRLERESDEVDRHYRQFRSKQAQAENQFYERNSNRLRPFGSFLSNKGESGFNFNINEQGQPSSIDLHPDAMSHMFVKYHNLNDKTKEASTSQNVSRSRCPECPRNSRRGTDNEPPCCSNFVENHQKKSKLDLAQLVEWHFNQAISCMANNQSISDMNLQRENQQEENKSEQDSKKEEKEERQFDNQSVASSGILGEMLAAGTSGVSLSDVEASDEKSESQPENPKD